MTKRADALAVGDVVEMATGPVVVLRREETFGGVELLVRPKAGRGGKGTGRTPRVLWFWPRQAVEVSGVEALSEADCSLGRAGRSEAARRSHAARRAAASTVRTVEPRS